jgi:DNA-binding beta-propeller fold protein YncE
MRVKKTLASICLIIAAGTVANVRGQSPVITGPVLGFGLDAAGAAIEPILGVPGASLLTNPLELNIEIRRAVVSPKQDYALAVRAEDGQAVFIDLAGGRPITPIPGNHNRPDIMALSPTGSAAAIYDSESSSLEIVGNLPKDPHIIHELNASPISGRASSVALSDDGSVALVTFREPDRTSLWMMDSSGAVQRLPVDQAAGATFFVNRNDAIIGDDANHAIFIIIDAGRTAAPLPLVSDLDGIISFSNLAASDDGGRVFLTDTNGGNVAIIDIQTRTPVVLSCGCQPTGLDRLKGNSVFRLNNASDQPMMLLEASGSEPRIVLVPPNPSARSEAAQ